MGREQLGKCNLIRDGQPGLSRWVLANLGFFKGIAALGGNGSGLDGLDLCELSEVANWDAAAELLLASWSCADEPVCRVSEVSDESVNLARSLYSLQSCSLPSLLCAEQSLGTGSCQ